MGTSSSIQDKILQALGDYLKRDPKTISPEASLREDLGLDSMATIELLYRVEEAFDLQIPDQDLQGLTSVRHVVQYVERRLAPAAKPTTASTRVKKAAPGKKAKKT